MVLARFEKDGGGNMQEDTYYNRHYPVEIGGKVSNDVGVYRIAGKGSQWGDQGKNNKPEYSHLFRDVGFQQHGHQCHGNGNVVHHNTGQ